MKNNRKNITISEIDERLFLRMMRGDSRCEFPKGTIVQKTDEDPGGDLTPIGTKGVVLGNIYDEVMGELYYVKFETNQFPTACVKFKIKAC